MKKRLLCGILLHNDQGSINRTVTMRMIFTHGIADYTRTLTIRAVIADAQLVHIIQRSALYRL